MFDQNTAAVVDIHTCTYVCICVYVCARVCVCYMMGIVNVYTCMYACICGMYMCMLYDGYLS